MSETEILLRMMDRLDSLEKAVIYLSHRVGKDPYESINILMAEDEWKAARKRATTREVPNE